MSFMTPKGINPPFNEWPLLAIDFPEMVLSPHLHFYSFKSDIHRGAFLPLSLLLIERLSL